MRNRPLYDVVVVGAGHAGCEAALACARMGVQTLLITLHLDSIGLLSCNPAIGGIGKGQLVKEIDALGGEMARATDACAMQFRTLNASKGPAVWSSRAQVDRKRYSAYIQKILTGQENLQLYAGEVLYLLVKDKVIQGVQTNQGERILAKTVIIAPGTFLNGLIHIGMRSFPGGRIEEQGRSCKLARCLQDFNFRILRFKTGTCARLNGQTIDSLRMKVQHGDEPPIPFSLATKKLNLKQVPCYITYTDEKTHSIIRKNLNRSPLFSGKIKATGVRYCPSFEDKVVKFPHHNRHQIFLEPEGLDTDEYYPNGLSTSLPEDVQEEFIHRIPGLEQVKINRFGYGIEHDVVIPTQLYPTLETKLIKNLYLAGQINGTTGYEEAAAQGLIAGINAALFVQGKQPFILQRSTSYIGVLIDDLTTKGTLEPYRMFTSRVEYRLIIREDNADLRLRKLGCKLGLVKKNDYQKTLEKQRHIQAGLKYLREHQATVPLLRKDKKVTLYQLLKRPQVKIEDLQEGLPVKTSSAVLKGIEIEVKYSGFIRRQLAEVRSFKHLEKIKIPEDMDYNAVRGLSQEIKEKLAKFRPLTLGQANRISGITPVAIMILLVYIKKRNRPEALPKLISNPRQSQWQRHRQLKKSKRPYYRFSEYLKERFGCKVYKASIDAGFSCPNRDGSKSKNGCIYCDNRAFSVNKRMPPRPIEVQLKEGIDFGRKRFKAEKFIVYFQAYTNTYASVQALKERYDSVKGFKDVVGISIGTRPDCVNGKVLDLIASYAEDYEVWLEYGLQSIHKKTLEFINRGHLYADFLEAIKQTRARARIKICTHIILGLPGETRQDILQTARELGRLKLEGIKIHPLHIIKGTKLEEQFRSGLFKPLGLDEYISLATQCLEYLWPDTVIQRISAECPREFLVEPLWILQKDIVLNRLEDVMLRENKFQGRLYQG